MLLNTVALEKNQSTASFKTNSFGRFVVMVYGDLNTEYLTMYASKDDATWVPFFVDGMPQNVTYPVDSINAARHELPGGFYFRYTMSNGGGTPDGVFVEVDGTNIEVD